MGERQSDADRPAVDASLIDSMMRLSPGERLRQNDRAAALAESLREAFIKRTERWPSRAR